MKNALGFIFLSALFSLASVPALASREPFDAPQLEAAVVDYCSLARRDEREADELSSALSEEIALLHPVPFNDLVGHLLADYRHHAEDRAAISSLITKIREASGRELHSGGGIFGKEEWIQTILDDTFTAWTAAYTFGFGKGLWKSRGKGLATLPRFREALTKAGENIPLNFRTRIAITLAGGTAGAIHAALNTLEIRKTDPEHLLEAIQKDLLNEFQDRIHDLEGALASIKRMDSSTPESDRSRTKKLDELQRAAKRIQSEAGEIYETAPGLHGKLSLILEDLQALEQEISRARSDDLIRAIGDAF